MKKSLLATTIGSLILLGGCASYNEIEETQSRIEKQISEEANLVDKLKDNKPVYKNIVIGNKLFVSPISESEATKPDWWFIDTQHGRGIDIPFFDALDMVVTEGVNFSFGRNVNKKKRISYRGRTVGESIESIAAATGYSYRILGDNKLVWSLYETRTFEIATGPGKDYFGQGKGAGESNSEDTTINASTEYANANGEIDALQSVYEELLTYSSFKKAVAITTNSYRDLPDLNEALSGETTTSEPEDVQTEDIPIYLNRATSTITVRDTPAVLDEMQKIVRERNNLFRTNVYLEIDIIEVKLTNEGQQALDISGVVNSLTNATIETGLVAGTAASQIGRASTTLPTNIISMDVTGGSLKGSKLLMEALSYYGAVSSRTMPRQTLQPNTASKLADFENVYFIEERAATNTANVGTEFAITQNNLDVGFSLYVMPTIFKNDVTIRMATNMSSLLDLTRNGDTTTTTNGEENSTASYVESPRTSKKDFYSKFTVTAGDTMVLSGLSREIKSIRRGKGLSELIAKSEFGDSERIETIITVTPYIYRPRS